MELNDYQKRAMTTCMPSCDNFSYMMLNLVGEVGEFAGKVAKQIRKENVVIGGGTQVNRIGFNDCEREEMLNLDEELQKEAGDILWQLSGLCSVMGWKLEDVGQMNLDKLAARQKAGTIDGSGDGVYDRKP